MAGRAPGRTKPTRAILETRMAFVPSESAQADLEPRHSAPWVGRPQYPADEEFH